MNAVCFLDLQNQDITKSFVKKITLIKDDEQLLDTWGFSYRKGDQLMIHQTDTHTPVFDVLVRSRSPQMKLDFGGGSETKGAPRT